MGTTRNFGDSRCACFWSPAYRPTSRCSRAEWISHKQGLGGENDPTWFVIGIIVGDLTGLLLAVSILLTGFASWKSTPRLGQAAGALVTVALLASLVAVWAMTTKPT